MKSISLLLVATIFLATCNLKNTPEYITQRAIADGNLLFHLDQSTRAGYQAWQAVQPRDSADLGQIVAYPAAARMHVVFTRSDAPGQVLFECFTDTLSYHVTDTSTRRRDLRNNEKDLVAIMKNTYQQIIQQGLLQTGLSATETTILPYKHHDGGWRVAVITETMNADSVLWGGDYIFRFDSSNQPPASIEVVHPTQLLVCQSDTSTGHLHHTSFFSPIDYFKLRSYRDRVNWRHHRIHSDQHLFIYYVDMPSLNVQIQISPH